MLVPTVMWGNSPPAWITYPMLRRSSSPSIPVTSWPSITMLPLVGSISRLIILSVVVLPQPDGPTNMTTLPAGISRVSPPTAGSL